MARSGLFTALQPARQGRGRYTRTTHHGGRRRRRRTRTRFTRTYPSRSW